jgi:hypothetical protein
MRLRVVMIDAGAFCGPRGHPLDRPNATNQGGNGRAGRSESPQPNRSNILASPSKATFRQLPDVANHYTYISLLDSAF